MSTLVSIDCPAGILSRYECGGEVTRLTHRMRTWPKSGWGLAPVEAFRLMPDECYLLVDPPPRPTGPPCGFGIRAAA